jgi:hypothetical protein
MAAMASLLVPGLAVLGGGTPAEASTSSPAVSAPLTDPGLNHHHRHGAVPRPTTEKAAQAIPAGDLETKGRPKKSLGGPLRYDGGPVVSGSPKVYLVFYGSQWGTQGTDGAGYATFTGDPDGVAPELQALYAGLGSDQELWSAIATEYCQGITTFTSVCPASAGGVAHVAYPHPSILGGVWEDTSATPPSGTPGNPGISAIPGAQLAQEAADAAGHFGDTSVDAQYVIVSPTGTNPDGWLNPTTGFCAYHDNTGDWGAQVSGPNVAYTNMPYIPDVSPTDCSGLANPQLLDGLTEVASHEYAEVLTDPLPESGTTAWTDRRGNEIADKCQFITPGDPGAAYYLTLGTGSFDVQGLWANDSGKKGGCVATHASVLLSSPGKRVKATVGTSVSEQISALDVLGHTLSFTPSGLPAGLVMDSATGTVTGTPTTRGGSQVTVTAADGVSSVSVVFRWLVRK